MTKQKIEQVKSLLKNKGNVSNMPIGDNSKPWTFVFKKLDGSGYYKDENTKYTQEEIDELEQNFNIIAITIHPGDGNL